MVPEVGLSAGPSDIDMDTYILSDDVDYDAEGETDDEAMEGMC